MAAPSRQTLLQHVLADTAAADTPTGSASAILSACVRHTSADYGEIYLLKLKTARYEPFVSHPRGQASSRLHVQVEGLHVPDERIASLASVGAPTPDRAVTGVVVFAVRGATCVGLIRLDGVSAASLSDAERGDLLACANLVVSVYEQEFAFNLLSSLQQPIDFGQSDEEFFGQIAILIADSSGMEFVALRERSEDRQALRCLALWGFPDDADRSDFDLQPLDAFPPFARALAGETVVVPKMSGPDTAELRKRPWSKPVRSFVVMPINVGIETFGILSVGARCHFDYQPLEERGFESIANGVGVSITNFRNSHRQSQQIGEHTEAAVAHTAVEAARAARHEAIGHIDTCNIKLASLYRRLGKLAATYEPELDSISGELQRVAAALDKIKFATKAQSLEWSRVSLRRLWDEARAAVAGRLDEEHIDVRVQGGDAEVFAIPDRLRHVFLNLLLNSTDAFREAKKSGRKIEFTIDPQPGRARDILLSYHDNATGVNPQRLRVPSEADGDLPLRQLVFEPGVTSKRDGSGFGLWLVRNILQEHHGSIDLIDYRGGVTFVIRLPKTEQAATGGTP